MEERGNKEEIGRRRKKLKKVGNEEMKIMESKKNENGLRREGRR
jgi:hypothetical protein